MRNQSKQALYFSLLLLAFMLTIVVLSFQYDSETRLMPLLISIPTLCLIIFQILVQFNPKLQSRFEIDLFSESGLVASPARQQLERGNLLYHAFVIILYFVMILFFGFLVATPFYLVLFFKTYGKQSWFKCITSTIVVWGLLYLIFNVVMKFNLFEGILFGGRL